MAFRESRIYRNTNYNKSVCFIKLLELVRRRRCREVSLPFKS